MMDAQDAPAQDLPTLKGRDAALVARFPLPDGVPDALVNKKLLASALDVSTTTIDAWLILPEDTRLPSVERGTNGRSYVFRLSVAYAWRQERDAAEDADRQLAVDAAAQLRLSLLGGSAEDQARAVLSPRQQAEALKVENEWILAAAKRREFIRAAEVAEAFEVVFAAIRDGLDAAPDRLGRELSLGGPEVEAIQVILDDILRTAQADLEILIKGE
jgi:phage terminase Nu1 subunit (DNA packaging protein)